VLGSDRSDLGRLDIDMLAVSGIEPVERSSQPGRSAGNGVASEQPQAFDAAPMITSESYFTSAIWSHAFELRLARLATAIASHIRGNGFPNCDRGRSRLPLDP
jgi:hypothetical protein